MFRAENKTGRKDPDSRRKNLPEKSSHIPVPTTVPIDKIPELLKEAEAVKVELEEKYQKFDQQVSEGQ